MLLILLMFQSTFSAEIQPRESEVSCDSVLAEPVFSSSSVFKCVYHEFEICVMPLNNYPLNNILNILRNLAQT